MALSLQRLLRLQQESMTAPLKNLHKMSHQMAGQGPQP